MSNKPTPAEAMALYYSLDRPSGYEVAARFTAAGRPINARTITRWKKQGWQSIPKAPRPTPAEARAMWDSLEQPTLHKVADAFKSQGRPIGHVAIWNWKQAGWSRVTARNAAKAARAIEKIAAAVPARTSNRPTPAEAQAIWDSLEQPSLQKVANAFKAQGRPIGPVAIWNWKQAGWSRVTAKNAVAKATRAIEKIAAAVPALTGDPMTTLSDILTGNNVVPGERHDDERNNDQRHDDARSNAEHAEQVLLRTMRTATAVNDAIRDIAAAVPEAGTPVPEDAPLPTLLTRPEGLATLMMASNAGLSVAIEGVRRLPAMRAEEAAEGPGTQTV